jgi:ribosomal protein L37E
VRGPAAAIHPGPLLNTTGESDVHWKRRAPTCFSCQPATEQRTDVCFLSLSSTDSRAVSRQNLVTLAPTAPGFVVMPTTDTRRSVYKLSQRPNHKSHPLSCRRGGEAALPQHRTRTACCGAPRLQPGTKSARLAQHRRQTTRTTSSSSKATPATKDLYCRVADPLRGFRGRRQAQWSGAAQFVLMMMTFTQFVLAETTICSCRNNNQPTAIYPLGTFPWALKKAPVMMLPSCPLWYCDDPLTPLVDVVVAKSTSPY